MPILTDHWYMRRRHILTIFLSLTLIAAACSSNNEEALATDSDASSEDAEFIAGEPTATPLEEETSSEPDELAQESSTSNDDATDDSEAEPDAEEPEDLADPEETDEPDAAPCEAPTLVAHFVDVALDDPDGGLNMRTSPGSQEAVVDTFPRSSELIATGNCQVLSSRDWWEVTTSDGSQTGWVAARFLSDLPVFNPGLGNPIDDPDNVGITRPTLEELVAAIAESYGFDEDLVVLEVIPPEASDAVGGEATYELTGLKDDASNGYLVEISFSFDREEDGGEIESYTTLRVTSQALCTRGVTADGLCT